MVIAVLADEILKEEFLLKSFPEGTEIIWADGVRSLGIIDADIYFDLLFEYDTERINALKKLLPKTVVVNAVAYTTKDIRAEFIRINAWPTMLKREITEIALPNSTTSSSENSITDSTNLNPLNNLGWKFQIVPDIRGMITPVIITMIINEAWYTFGAGTSSKEEIDTAMKLGTNYPMGPFEWGIKIGLKNIVELLKELQRNNERYTIAPALQSEITYI
jgi:3-hydroxybutyryl-CoA dehydrogenase